MDAKSLAKSKRAHSLHHSKKPYSVQKAKAASGGSSGDGGSRNKALGKQVKEKARQSALPSNWDRYEEDEFDGSGELSGDSMNKATDIVLPKSKGADYSHLIAEAQSERNSHSSLDRFLSLDDIFPGDFKIGVGPILSVRGEGILSWIGDENFVVEGGRSENPEAPYLSLNLNALAERLEKVNLSERLFIEADLLPPELVEDQRGKTSDRSESGLVQAGATEARTKSEELELEDFPEENKLANRDTEVLSSRYSADVRTNCDPFNQRSNILNQTIVDLNTKPDRKSVQNRAMGSTTVLNSSSVAISGEKLSMFEATAAEAELDMLLDSFSETKLLDSPDDTLSVLQIEALTDQPQRTGTAPSSSGTKTFTAELEHVLDDLLEESSNSSGQNASHHPGKATGRSSVIESSPLQSVSKSKVLDDFDSWLDTIN